MNKRYPGLGIIGNERLAGLYGMDEGIIDGKGTGIQHLFLDTFDIDLIHSACTLVKVNDVIYYGNRKETKEHHQVHLKPYYSNMDQGYLMTDKFADDIIQKTDRACAYDDNKIALDFDIENLTDEAMSMEIYTFLILRNDVEIDAKILGDKVYAKMGKHQIAIKTNEKASAFLVEESPTGFLYRTANAVLYDEKHNKDLKVENMLGVLVGKKVTLEAKGAYNFKWGMIFGDSNDDLSNDLKTFDINTYENQASTYWRDYLDRGHELVDKKHETIINTNRIAIKSAMINGFVPADLTGHYFTEGTPSYYARDSLMIARAFLLSGHMEEFSQVVNYLKARDRKISGEFYQRYNGMGQPSEGANNSVFHQLDSIGYYMKNVRDYYELTGDLLVTQDEIKALMDVLINCDKKHGMVGPEGGVNEGVYGPAFITSSNMFIYGGIKSSIELLEDKEYKEKMTQINKNIMAGIESTYLEDEGYMYGYVTYHDDLVKKYDTPVYFGVLYGFDNTENMKKTHNYLIKNAAYFQDGIGYSEQEYHLGPWIFNTAACAEYAYINGDMDQYHKKMDWIMDHANRYGLMPEAISGDDENLPYINPLIWACAETVSAAFISKRQK